MFFSAFWIPELPHPLDQYWIPKWSVVYWSLSDFPKAERRWRAWDEADFQLTTEYWERCIYGHQHQYINCTTMLMNFLINTQSKIHIHETAMIRRNRTMTAQLEVCLTFNIRLVLQQSSRSQSLVGVACNSISSCTSRHGVLTNGRNLDKYSSNFCA